MFKVLLVFLLLLNCNFCSVIENNGVGSTTINDAPILGVLSQEMSYHLNGKFPDMYESFIAASYVKFIEGAGARVVPIWINRPREYYEEIMSKINGVLFPGGATWFNQSNGYADAGRHIYNIAIEINEAGKHMPVWGTCLGFELLTYLSAGREHRSNCNSYKQSIPLKFKSDYHESKLFNNISDDIYQILKTEDVTSNFHTYCVTESNFTEFGLGTDWRILTTNEDIDGLKFISTIEHKKYPFYGVQFHPEKNIYEWVLHKNITHTSNAIKANQYFAQFLVNESRKSLNQFLNVEDENKHLIYNFPTTFTALVKSAYLECYFFEKNIDYTRNIITDPYFGHFSDGEEF